MPATFEGFGLKLLYPDNWKLVERAEDEGDQGTTFDLPGGGFVSLETLPITREDELVLSEIDQMLRDQYEDLERESVTLPGADDDEKAIDLRFYYLDLVVMSRVVLLDAPPPTREQMPIAGRILAQLQAELSDFEAAEPVFNAILQQIRTAELPSEE
ncbi:hypothetical protein LOC71_17120 [Rhodopirellula sp. JC740]|uniref:Uncharacterized protein n=1 Tax=Rhodopirellula halodulae TaxID=2894198 RepID=A0ABS8NKC0_9BACT|nr:MULTISPECIES: hypothetical protein [unclassified Rhodopirellula]MCC9644007.1 hypothetical protein [Rhodopirellula sp. JC740]MCC9657170.1 hypothetical protein [Rhodopirellula sp. JC737]